MNKVVFTASSAADLERSVMQAFFDAESKGVGFRLELAPGDYGSKALQLTPMDSPSSMDIEIVAPSGPAVLRGALSVEGSSVSISGVVLDKPSLAAIAVEVRASKTIDIKGLAVLEARDPGGRDRPPVVQLAPTGTDVQVRIDRMWLVGNAMKGSTLVALREVGRGSFDRVEIQRSAIAGNTASTGVWTGFAKAVSLTDVVAVEPGLTGPLLAVRSPATAVSLSGGVYAANKLASHNVGEDSKLSDFPHIDASGAQLRGPGKGERVKGASFGPALKAPKDWTGFLEAARRLDAPDAAALLGL